METKKKLGGWAFLPILVFLGLYVGCGIYFTVTGAESSFGFMPRHVALIIGLCVALLMAPSMKISEKMDIMTKGMGDSGAMMVVLIYLLAGGFQGAAAAMGGKESVINLALNFVPASLLIPGVFLICCLISTAIGTSMGTIAAMAPVAIGIANGAGLNVAMTAAAVIGGSYFGDNLSMISDTTISAAQGCGSEMRDKFKMNFFIALPAAIAAMILYGVLGGAGGGAIETGAYNIIQVLPYLLVLVLALVGLPVVGVLLLGIATTAVIGVAQGTVTIYEWAQGLGGGMSDMFSISIVCILVSGLISLIRAYGGIEWLVNGISSRINSRRGAQYGIGLLSGVLSAAMVNNTLGIIVTCPIAKEIGGQYDISPRRLASIVDIFACAFLAMMPHDGGMLIVTELSGASPLDVMKYSFYMFALIISVCVSIAIDKKN